MKQQNPIYSALLFLIWPFIALISAFWNYRQRWAKNVLWAFVAFYGYTFAVGAESKGTDIFVYVSELQTLHGKSLTLWSALEYFQSSGEVDVLRTLIAVVLSRFTGDAAVLTLIYGIIFGFFFSRNMWFVLERMEGKVKVMTLLLFASFFLVIPIWNINGFRFWTAAHVFVYGLLPYLYNGDKKGLIIAPFSLMVHFAFLIPVLILGAYVVAGNRTVYYFGFFLATLFISEIDIAAFNNVVEQYAPQSVQERSESYRSEAYVETYRADESDQQLNWYVTWYTRGLKWAVTGFLILIFVKARSFLEERQGWLNLYSFVLLFYGVANIFASLPSGGRFIAVANLCALALIILFIQNQQQEQTLVHFARITLPAFLLFVVVSIRMGLISLSATSILGNPVIALLTEGEHIPLNEVMRLVMTLL